MKDKFDIKEIYTPLSVAKKEIWKRWNNKELRKKVEDFLGGDVPYVLEKEPRAVLNRQLVTPDMEFLHFLDLSKIVGLKPLCWEFLEDVFVTTNHDKAFWGRMAIFERINRKFDNVIQYKKIIDLTGSEEKKKLNSIKTLWGEKLVDFHHRLLNSCGKSIDLYDGSTWYGLNGSKATKFYPKFFSLFIRNGVLFENFFDFGKERELTRNIVLPAFKKIRGLFGVQPLIVRIIPEDSINDLYWWCHDSKIIKNKWIKT